MSITLSIMPAINAAITAQNTTLTTAINAARDNVNAATVTQLNTQTTALNTTVNAARDNVNAATVAQLNTQTTAINGNVDTDFAAVLAAVNAKGAVKSVQRGSVQFNVSSQQQITIAAVVPEKSIVIVHGTYFGSSSAMSVDSQIANATRIDLAIGTTNASSRAQWQVVEFW